MSILEDFIHHNLQQLPNEAEDTPSDSAANAKTHHKHHGGKPSMHNATHRRLHTHSTTTVHATPPQAPQVPHASQACASATNCLPCRQKNAKDFLAGNTPGVMAFYAPEEQRLANQHPCPQPANIRASTRADNATIENAETVQRLVEWREEAAY